MFVIPLHMFHEYVEEEEEHRAATTIDICASFPSSRCQYKYEGFSIFYQDCLGCYENKEHMYLSGEMR